MSLGGAAFSGLLQHIDELIEKGAVIDHRDVQGRSAMHLAAWRGNLKVFQALKARATIALTDHQGRSVMHHAAMTGSTHIVEELLNDIDTSVLNEEDNDGWLHLHWACRFETNRDVVARLTAQEDGSWAQLTTPRGWNPEKIAIFHKALRLIPSDKRTEKWEIRFCHLAFVCDGRHLEVSQVFRKSQRSLLLNIPNNQPIYGIRWRCKVCQSFNFCFKCAWTREDTHPHGFETLPKGEDPETTPVPGTW